MARPTATLCILLFFAFSAAVTGCGTGSPAAAPTAGTTRTYYIAAEDVDWDYAPGGVNLIADPPTPFTSYPAVGESPGTFTHNIVFGTLLPDAPLRTPDPAATQIGTV